MACVTKECEQLFKALADETRLTILEIISCGEICACEMTKLQPKTLQPLF